MTDGDELMLLWQQGPSTGPDPEEVARLAGKATMKRFDNAIFKRNFAEYAAAFVLLVVFGWQAARGNHRFQNSVGFLCVAFVAAYLWWQHRRTPPLDVTADARSYQTAMLNRIDQQIRLLNTARYWYLLPLYIPPVWTTIATWQNSKAAAILMLAAVTAAYWLILRLNENFALPRLRAERTRIEALYKE